METQYHRCKKCGHIFEESEECPNCGEKVDKSVNENVSAEPTFNLND
jgi:rubrerythrin